jgi:hypothetical protein
VNVNSADATIPDEVYQNVTASIEYAEAVMSKTRTSVEKARVSKENRNKVVSKASEIVNALLEPASQVANLLDGIGAFFPPCLATGTALAVRAFFATSSPCDPTIRRP